jgi:hypothetical protein
MVTREIYEMAKDKWMDIEEDKVISMDLRI